MWQIVQMDRIRMLMVDAADVTATRRLIKPKRLVALICLVAGLVWPMTASNCLAQTMPTLPPGVQDVIKLVKAGLGEEVVLAHIKNTGATYTLSADQIIYVHQQGVSENEMKALMGSGSATVPASPAPDPAPPPPTYAPAPSAAMVPMAPTLPAAQPASLPSFQPQLAPYGAWMD